MSRATSTKPPAVRRKTAKIRPKKRPTQERAARTVDALLGATARILAQRGWSGLTTNHVAARAGVSIGTLYEWFPSKEALVAALVDRHLDRAETLLAQRAESLVGEGRIATLRELAELLATTMVELHEDDPRLHRALFEEVPHPAATRSRILALEARMTAVLGAELERRGIARPALAAKLVIDLLEAATHRWATTKDDAPVPRDALIAELTAMIAAYLGDPSR